MSRLLKYRNQIYCFENFKNKTFQKESIIHQRGGGGEGGSGSGGDSGGGEGGGGK